jgi:hypothetical protein
MKEVGSTDVEYEKSSRLEKMALEIFKEIGRGNKIFNHI